MIQNNQPSIYKQAVPDTRLAQAAVLIQSQYPTGSSDRAWSAAKYMCEDLESFSQYSDEVLVQAIKQAWESAA